MNRLAIFDCDGTLVDSGATIYRALSAAFDQNELNLPEAETCRKVIGLSLVEAMAALLPHAPAELHRSLSEDYKRAFWTLRSAGEVEEPLFDGVLELLDALDMTAGFSQSLLANPTAVSGIASRATRSTRASFHSKPPTGTLQSHIHRWSNMRSQTLGLRPRPVSSWAIRASTWPWR